VLGSLNRDCQLKRNAPNSGLNAEVTRTLAANCGLDLTQTVLLPDPEMQVTKSVYKVDPCPREIDASLDSPRRVALY
jgi:hypothetical protein